MTNFTAKERNRSTSKEVTDNNCGTFVNDTLKSGGVDTPWIVGSYPESTVNRAGQNFVDKNGPSQSLTGRQGSNTTGAKSTNPQTGQTNIFRNAQPKNYAQGQRVANFETKPQPKGPSTSNVHVKIKE